MSEVRVLAFDFGASSGRAIIFGFDGKKITQREINRFVNSPTMHNGILWWNAEYLFDKINESVAIALSYGIDAVGIDTWGCDFAVVSEDAVILPPMNYRDLSIVGAASETEKMISADRQYAVTGIQIMDINTVNRFAVLDRVMPKWRDNDGTVLLMADLFAWHLTGEKRCELTNASTTAMIDAESRCFSKEILSAIGVNEEIFAPIIKPGQVYGYLKNEFTDKKVPVIAVCTHDTASAVAAVPADTQNFAYLSCGTWSLMGTELPHPVINDVSKRYNFTNEIGVDGTVRLLKNIAGLWIIQEARRTQTEQGNELSFADISAMASGVMTDSYIDPDDRLFAPCGDMIERVNQCLKNSGQALPCGIAQSFRVIYDSLALKYKWVLERLQKVCGHTFDCLHVVGGGVRDKLLMQLAANALGMPVIAGPSEATAIGNAAVQFISLGCISGIREARKIICDSVPFDVYEPKDRDLWLKKYEKFKRIIDRG